jgi:hypothetical protein
MELIVKELESLRTATKRIDDDVIEMRAVAARAQEIMAGDEVPPVDEVVRIQSILDGFAERLKMAMAAREEIAANLAELFTEELPVN